jgi:AcrR family transcriptional regulator
MSTMSTPPQASRNARQLARDELTRLILASARAQLASVGPAQLSVRAVARDVGMVSSAVYRYFPSRDDLLTALLVVCYDELGEAVEQQEAAVTDRADLPARWRAVAGTVRSWALAHPHDFGLLYGSPVPGYSAPRATVGPATRVTRLLLAQLRDLADAPERPAAEVGALPEPGLHGSLAGVRDLAGADLPDELVVRGLGAWSGLIGAVTLELHGHLANAVSDLDTYFAALARQLSPAG